MTGPGSAQPGGQGLSKQLSNAGLNVLGNGTPTNQGGKQAQAQKENAMMLPPRAHPSGAPKPPTITNKYDPEVFGTRV